MTDGSKESLIKMEYEVMHASVEELSRSHNVPASVIQNFIKTEGWKRAKVNGDQERLEMVKDQLASMSTYNQAMVTRKFLGLQNKILEVAHNLLNQVNGLEDVNALKVVSEVIELHRPHVLTKAKDKGEGTSEGIRISVISQFGENGKGAVNAVQITDSAGKHNGIGPATRMN